MYFVGEKRLEVGSGRQNTMAGLTVVRSFSVGIYVIRGK